ncbi:protein NETWORKED 4A [Neltuma alba]|uniref:protein NETWORKED 4A n=1 Tax=Neltuma alba TaxID=207710 RepID=UPI0010A4CA78|nr:protein NETWORKED 4A-like [Prosopis alba]XP_028805086.1 protein NETWORKED 4A-like [Prosopis alba]XP_028805087.1 protein NETWORKED 4A-like [Prosopis alba]
MATSPTHAKQKMKRLESRKSHSWWWDSHVSPKNSKWLAENLEEMDKRVKRMLKLIEEDADSFAKKAEMYYQKRPELISLVEDFYRMYRSLAERYDHVTIELRKNIPSDLQSQGSGISDLGSVSGLSSTMPSPGRPSHRKSSNRAAGFDVFLGSGGNGSDAGHGEGSESSMTSDSEEDSDDSSIHNDSGFPGSIDDYHRQSRKIMELEIEVRDLKEKIWQQEEENAEKRERNENCEEILAKVNEYEQELEKVNKKLRLSEEEISVLKIELDRLRSLEPADLQATIEFSSTQEHLEPHNKIKSPEEELRITKETLEASEKHIASLEFETIKSAQKIQELQDQLDSASKDIAAWKTKFNTEKKETNELQKRLENTKLGLLDQDHEIRDLKAAIADAETRNVNSEKAETEALKGEIKEREKNRKNLNATMNALKSERDDLNAEVGRLKIEINRRDDRIEQLGWHLNQLHMEHVKLLSGREDAQKQVKELKQRGKELEEEIERHKNEILQGAEEKREAIRQLCLSLEHYRNDYNRLRQDYAERRRVSVLAS